MIEMLAVLAVIGILAAAAIPVVAPLMRASSINHAAAMLSDEFNQARQFALTKNRDVEVRFYQLPKKSGGDQAYRAFRAFLADGADSSKSRPFGKVKYFPEPVIISDNSQFSTLLDHGNSNRSGLSHGQEILPGRAAPVPYVGFMFRANGGTNLSPVTPPLGNWFLTLYREDAAKDTATELPHNYCNIQIDPTTGRSKIYRP